MSAGLSESPVRRRVLRLLRNEQVILSILTVLIGVAAAYGSIAFRKLIALLQWGGFGALGEQLTALGSHLPWWQVNLVSALDGLMVGFFSVIFQQGGRPHGVADIMEAGALRSRHSPLKEGAVAALEAVISIGSGASVGREGPVVDIGASLASWGRSPALCSAHRSPPS